MLPPSFSSDVMAGVTFGNYVVGELIGRGAMASVYRAEHRMLNKPVALKLMDQSLLDSPDARERFLREGRVVASISHPNVVNITDVGVHEGTPYLVMELLVGQDLHGYLARHAPLDDRSTTRLALPLIAALSAAHEVSVVHRDVKPSNIFLQLGPNGELIPKVLDFGISKLSLERTGFDLVATSPNQLIGSPLYLAPEALRGPGQIGPASDQYSLGVVLYECVTGRTPFQGDTLMALLGALSRGGFAPPSSIRPDIAPALERVIERAMALDPKDRFPTMRDMGAALLGLAAERTQVVWASSFQSAPSTDAPDTARRLLSRLPSGPLAVPKESLNATTAWRRPPLRRWWIAAGAAVLGAGALFAASFAGAPPQGKPLSSAIAVELPSPAAAPQAAPVASGPGVAPLPAMPSAAMPSAAAPPPALPSAAAQRAPGIAIESSGVRGRALATRMVQSLQPARRGSPAGGQAPERRRVRRATGTETSEAGAPHTASPAPAASGESAPRRRGANESPLLD